MNENQHFFQAPVIRLMLFPDPSLAAVVQCEDWAGDHWLYSPDIGLCIHSQPNRVYSGSQDQHEESERTFVQVLRALVLQYIMSMALHIIGLVEFESPLITSSIHSYFP